MSDDTHDHTTDLAEPYDYEDPVSQRAVTFCHVPRLADTIRDESGQGVLLADAAHAQRQHQGILDSGPALD